VPEPVQQQELAQLELVPVSPVQLEQVEPVRQPASAVPEGLPARLAVPELQVELPESATW
jgi:hypothetical protein